MLLLDEGRHSAALNMIRIQMAKDAMLDENIAGVARRTAGAVL
jgi:hypothetical protein